MASGSSSRSPTAAAAAVAAKQEEAEIFESCLSGKAPNLLLLLLDLLLLLLDLLLLLLDLSLLLLDLLLLLQRLKLLLLHRRRGRRRQDLDVVAVRGSAQDAALLLAERI